MRIFFLLILLPFIADAQYAPQAGQSGSTAIFKDSSIIKSWATNCYVNFGYKDISHPDSGLVSNGISEAALGIADNGTISLGDGGFAILKFDPPITNGYGYDFAVFENSFSDYFLELAFVEVSSDSIHFFRFNSVSLTPESPQIPSFGNLDPVKINNLAGKYKGAYGTPFDLEELSGNNNLQLNSIRFIKIIDVIGSVNSLYASHDSQGHIINDPWPTLFPGGGFDLDAVGIINQQISEISENNIENNIVIFPVPSDAKISIKMPDNKADFLITDITGKNLLAGVYKTNETLNISSLPSGIYFIYVKILQGTIIKKLVKN